MKNWKDQIELLWMKKAFTICQIEAYMKYQTKIHMEFLIQLFGVTGQDNFLVINN